MAQILAFPSPLIRTVLLFAALLYPLRSSAWEVDCRACSFCRTNTDLMAAIDARIHGHLKARRTAAGIAMLEGGSSVLSSPISDWANHLPAASRPDPRLSRYRGSLVLDNRWFTALAPCVKVNGICIGTDKLAHLFQQGWEYYSISVLQHHGVARAERYGEWLEGKAGREDYARDEQFFLRQRSGRQVGYGGFGRTLSGVISHADLAANRAGFQMYRDMAAGTFLSISNYISPQLCEEANPSDYTPELRRLVEINEHQLGVTNVSTTK